MRRFTELAKNIILIVLGITMLALWTGYIYLQFDQMHEEDAVLERDFWIFTDATRAPTEISANSRFFSPASVSLILSGNGYTSAHNNELTDTLYTGCRSLMAEIFSSSYLCQKSDASAWSKALEVSDGILVEYFSPLPYTTVAMFMKKNDGFCAGEICRIEKLLLFADETNTPCALACDGSGNVYSFTWNGEESPAVVYDFNSNNLAAYTVNKGFIPFVFNKNGDSGKTFENLPEEYKLLSEGPSLPDTVASNSLDTTLSQVFEDGNSSYLEIVSEKALSEILDVFEINPNIVGYYSDNHTGLIFVGENMRLTITPKGAVTYSLIDKNELPITVASLLNTARTQFSANEILAAATEFLAKFSTELIGGDAVPILEQITYSSETEEMKFTFGYYYGLTKISLEDTDAITLTFNREGLIKASLVPLDAKMSDKPAEAEDGYLGTDMTPSVAARLATGSFSALTPVYPFKAYSEVIRPLWAMGGQK